MTQKEYKEILQDLKKRDAKSKIVKILKVTTKLVKGKLRKVVIVIVILANGLFANQAFACNEYTVQAGDSWSKLSTRTGFTIEYLKEINGKETNILKTGETIALPDMEEYLADSAHNETINKNVLVKKPVLSKETSKQNTVTTGNHNKTEEIKQVVYVVQKGDNLWKIARNYQTTIEKIMKDNGFSSTALKIGQTITIHQQKETEKPVTGNKPANEQNTEENQPASSKHTYIVKNGDNLWKIARNYQTTVEKIMKDNGLSSTTLKIGQTITIHQQKETEKPVTDNKPANGQNTEENQPASSKHTYIVKNGDNLWKIARNYKTTVEMIMKDNQLTSTKLKINQKLVIKYEKTK
ncbi:LysM peptidoglycan-binding domain-containing protein [Metabacillus fastidiosus]|uniref:LysM peptidoglycan-binding domain-containing protein n=1 Tax=Metabacillus fastidiosus TaxID=1458 RepID=UPI002E2331D5|nr:LysM peptidoglycan-binding domain-containing protein [Metabacillus fastidiosus]